MQRNWKKRKRTNEVERVLLIVVIVIEVILTTFILLDLLNKRSFSVKEYKGHQYLFYGNKPVEHYMDCPKCYDRFN